MSQFQFSSGQSDGLSRSGAAVMNQRMNARQQQALKRSRAAGGLADRLAQNPLSQQVAQSPLRQALQQRRAQSIAGLQGAQRDMAGPMNSVAAGSAGQTPTPRRFTSLGQVFGFRGSESTVDPGQRNQAMRFTLQPQMNGGDAIDAAYARRAAASAARPTARIGLGSDGQRMVAQGTPLSRLFSSASDAANRAKFEAARDARAERKAEARAMRQDQLAQQRQTAMSQPNQVGLVNPFQNPFALEAMRRQPELALGAVSSLNSALQDRGTLQAARSATVADQQYRQQDLGLRGALGMGRLDLDRQGMESENKYRGTQADAAMRTADANYLSAEAQAARAQAEADAIGDPANRQFQNQMDLFTAAAGIPGLENQARDLFSAMNGGEGSESTAQLPFTPAPDQMSGRLPPEQEEALVNEQIYSQGLSRSPLLDALSKSGMTRAQAMEYVEENEPGMIGSAIDQMRLALPTWAFGMTDREYLRKRQPIDTLRHALGMPPS